MKAYFFLTVAILMEVSGTMMLPLTQNFSKLVPTIILGVCYLGSFYLLTFALESLPLAIVYATWSGLGVFGIAILSYLFFGQALPWQGALGLFLIVTGVVLVNYYTNYGN